MRAATGRSTPHHEIKRGRMTRYQTILFLPRKGL